MRGGWRLPFGAVLVVALVTGCGLGGNKDQVCRDAVRAVRDYDARLDRMPPNDITQWKRAAAALATRYDALARKADDRRLRRALRAMAADWRRVSTQITPGDISRLQAAVQRTPVTLARACR